MGYSGLVQMIVRIGRGMGVSRAALLCLLSFALLSLGKIALAGSPKLMLWDDAIIDNKYDLSKSESIQLVYTNDLLSPGDRLAPLIPMDPGFTVLCCVEITADKPYTLDELKAKYPNSIGFVRRVQSLQGVRFAYKTKFVPEKEMSPAMRRISKGSGETYYSAPALLGATSQKVLESNRFTWSDWGEVTLAFRNPKSGWEEYRLNAKGLVSTIRVEALPD